MSRSTQFLFYDLAARTSQYENSSLFSIPGRYIRRIFTSNIKFYVVEHLVETKHHIFFSYYHSVSIVFVLRSQLTWCSSQVYVGSQAEIACSHSLVVEILHFCLNTQIELPRFSCFFFLFYQIPPYDKDRFRTPPSFTWRPFFLHCVSFWSVLQHNSDEIVNNYYEQIIRNILMSLELQVKRSLEVFHALPEVDQQSNENLARHLENLVRIKIRTL